MAQVQVTKTINIPARAAWQKLSAFSGIEDFSPIAKSVLEGSGVGAKRTCFMDGGVEIFEKINMLDDEKMNLEYEIITSSLPLSEYISQISVQSKDDSSCEISWQSTYQPASGAEEDAKNLLEGFYATAIDGLETFIKK